MTISGQPVKKIFRQMLRGECKGAGHQCLELSRDIDEKVSLHIEVDNGAGMSFCRVKLVILQEPVLKKSLADGGKAVSMKERKPLVKMTDDLNHDLIRIVVSPAYLGK